MIVVDASVVLELLLDAARADEATALITDGGGGELAVPHLLDAEVAHALVTADPALADVPGLGAPVRVL